MNQQNFFLKKHIWLFLLILFGAVSCQRTGSPANGTDLSSTILPIRDVILHEVYSDQVFIGREWMRPDGVGIGFVWAEDRNIPPENRPQTEEIVLSNKQSEQPFLFLNSPKPTTVLISVLLDYQQVSFVLDGHIGLLHEIKINTKGDLTLPFSVPISESGIHDLMVIAFINPYENSLNANEVMAGGNQIVGRRTVIKIGESGEIHNILPPKLHGSPIPHGNSLNLGVAFATYQPAGTPYSHPSELNRQLYVGQGDAGKDFPFQIWGSNLGGSSAVDYAIVLFQNYHQVTALGNKVNVAHLGPNEEIVFDTKVTLSPQSSIEQLQLVYIFDPYKSIVNNEVIAPFVFSSQRIAIEVTK